MLGSPWFLWSNPDMDLGNALRVSRFWLRARCRGDLELSDFSGSLLRGVFGAALRDLVCITGASHCDGCALRSRCSYAVWMETPAPDRSHLLPPGAASPHPWLLEPPQGALRISAGAHLEMRFLLFGRAHAQLGLCLLAFRRALAQGLGASRVALDLDGIRREDETDWSPVERYVPPQASPIVVPTTIRNVTLELRSPLRILRQGKVLPPDRLQFVDFFSALQRRLGLLEAFHEDAPSPDWDYRLALEAARSCTWKVEDAKWVCRERYSYRQERPMKWTGVVGKYHIANLPDILWPVLYRGQWIHVGKNTTFGFGEYQIVPSNFTNIHAAPKFLHHTPV